MLQLLLNRVKTGSSASVTLRGVNNPANPSETVISGKIYTNEYVDMAGRIINFINTYGMVSNYSSSALGNVKYESLVYMYSRILNYHHSNKVLPTYASITPWPQQGETSEYLVPTNNCQSNDQGIISLSSSLSGTNSQYTKATKIFNWVRDKISYFYLL